MYVQSSINPSNEPNINEDIPSSWAALLNMDCRRAIYYYLRWHTTALMTNDFEFLGEDQQIKYFDPDSASIYDIINGFMEDTLCGKFVCDRQGKFWAEIDVKAIDNATGTLPVNFQLQKNDWLNTVSIDERNTKELYYLEMGGFSYTSQTGTSIPYLACAPGDNLGFEGESDVQEGLALSSQGQLNTLVGNIFAYRNAKYPSIDMSLAGNYRIFDIAPQEQFPITLSATDNNRGISWINKHFHPVTVSMEYDGRNEALLSHINLHEVTQGFAGDTIVIPPKAPDDGDYDPGYEFPPVPIPTGTIVPPDYNTNHPDTCFVAGAMKVTGSVYQYILARTNNFNDAIPNWTNVLPSSISGTLVDVYQHPLAPGFMFYWLTKYGLWEIAGLNSGTSFTVNILNRETAATLVGTTGSSVDFVKLAMSGVDNYIYVYVQPSYGVKTPYLLKCDRRGAGAFTAQALPNFENPTDQNRELGFDIGYFGYPFILSTSRGGVLKSMDGVSWQKILDSLRYYIEPVVHIPKNSSNSAVYCSFSSDIYGTYEYLYKSTALGATGTFVDITPNIDGTIYNFHIMSGNQAKNNVITSSYVNPNYLAAMMTDEYGVLAGTKAFLLVSHDGGSTWTVNYQFPNWVNPSHPPANYLVMHPFDYTKLYIMGNYGYTEIMASSDEGSTWVEKRGDWITKFGTHPTYFKDTADYNFPCAIFPVF
jgi:hypothetical protein